MSCKPIGVFDSGVGGLGVLLEIKRLLPAEKVLYFADTLHLPYGPRSPKDLRRLVFAILRFFEEQGVKLVIMACNTSSAVVLPLASQVFTTPLFGMITPLARSLVAHPPGRLGLLATDATVASGAYSKELRYLGFDGQLVSAACSRLAALIEDGTDEQSLSASVEEYVAPLRAARVEAAVLGCTHYPFARETISRALGPQVTLMDPAFHVVEEVAAFMKENKLCCDSHASGAYKAYVSGDVGIFQERAQQLAAFDWSVEGLQIKNYPISYHLKH